MHKNRNNIKCLCQGKDHNGSLDAQHKPMTEIGVLMDKIYRESHSQFDHRNDQQYPECFPDPLYILRAGNVMVKGDFGRRSMLFHTHISKISFSSVKQGKNTRIQIPKQGPQSASTDLPFRSSGNDLSCQTHPLPSSSASQC